MAKHAKPAQSAGTREKDTSPSATGSIRFDDAGAGAPAGRHARHADAVSERRFMHRQRSRRMRIALTIVSVVLILLLIALGVFAYKLFTEANDIASQAAVEEGLADGEVASDGDSSDDVEVDAPDLVSLMGLTQDEAIEQLANGATVSKTSDITEENDDGEEEVVGTSVTIVLADKTADSSGNTPTVYLTLDSDGLITKAGYSASVSMLGYGSLSFSDAVLEARLIEGVLSAVGITASEEVELPDSEEYRTYADDGTTISQEQYTFSGTGTDASGEEYGWSCRLNYDYSAANVSNDLSDTLRLVYVYVSK